MARRSRFRPFHLVFLLAPLFALALLSARARPATGQALPARAGFHQVRAGTTANEDAAVAPADAAVEAPEEHPADPAVNEMPRKVFVGIYPFHVPSLDLVNNSYLMDFWLWFRWRGADIDPSKTFEFMNVFEGWDMLRQPVYIDDAGNAKPDALGDGWYYQVFRIQGRFTHPFDVHKYPFDDQVLLIELEDTDLTVQDMSYLVDKDSDVVDSTLTIPGWKISGVSAQVSQSYYPTNFGDTRRPPGADRYSHLRYEIHLGRPVLGYMATTILPVAIVMLITLVIFLINSKYFEGRLGLGITSLLSAVALQLTSEGNLPQTGYLVLLDHVYNLSYLVIFLSLLESVIVVRIHDRGEEQRAHRIDLWAGMFMTILFFGGVSLIVLLR